MWYFVSSQLGSLYDKAHLEACSSPFCTRSIFSINQYNYIFSWKVLPPTNLGFPSANPRFVGANPFLGEAVPPTPSRYLCAYVNPFLLSMCICLYCCSILLFFGFSRALSSSVPICEREINGGSFPLLYLFNFFYQSIQSYLFWKSFPSNHFRVFECKSKVCMCKYIFQCGGAPKPSLWSMYIYLHCSSILLFLWFSRAHSSSVPICARGILQKLILLFSFCATKLIPLCTQESTLTMALSWSLLDRGLTVNCQIPNLSLPLCQCMTIHMYFDYHDFLFIPKFLGMKICLKTTNPCICNFCVLIVPLKWKMMMFVSHLKVGWVIAQHWEGWVIAQHWEWWNWPIGC